MAGLQTSMMVGAVAAAVGAVLALFVQRGEAWVCVSQAHARLTSHFLCVGLRLDCSQLQVARASAQASTASGHPSTGCRVSRGSLLTKRDRPRLVRCCAAHSDHEAIPRVRPHVVGQTARFYHVDAVGAVRRDGSRAAATERVECVAGGRFDHLPFARGAPWRTAISRRVRPGLYDANRLQPAVGTAPPVPGSR